MERPIRTYQVTNPSVLFTPSTRITFRSTRPAGATVTIPVGGRRLEVLLTDVPVYGGMFAAELQVTYL
ncbi:hypothetical protein ABTY59_32085 [Streptomyces sp. NPDC096079]|uniref:hypothetical protein n=1 Tax=Streptomyces sp. NPDC096079 TaxID=3155820 RepID=UPI003318B2D3